MEQNFVNMTGAMSNQYKLIALAFIKGPALTEHPSGGGRSLWQL